MASPAGSNGRLSVLIFHRVLPVGDPLFPSEITASEFDRICAWLRAWFNVLPLDGAIKQLQEGTLPARAACVTFDDGYADNFHVALPVLKRHGLVATFFIATGFLDGGRMWNDTVIESVRGCTLKELELSSLGLGLLPVETNAEKQTAIALLIGEFKYLGIEERLSKTEALAKAADAALPTDLMMTSREVVELRHAGMQIGAHTLAHPILAELERDRAKIEIQGSKDFLENLLAEPVDLFAYPNGKFGEDYTGETVKIVRELGFKAAVSTNWGASGASDDLFQIRRFTPWDKSKLRYGLRMLANLRRHSPATGHLSALPQ